MSCNLSTISKFLLVPAAITHAGRRLLVTATSGTLLVQGLTVSATPPVTPKEPWMGSVGIRETTQQIMDRTPDYAGSQRAPFTAARKHPFRRIVDDNLLVDASSEDLPSVGGSPGESPPVEEGQSSGLNFTAVTFSDTGAFPPDSMGAVGPSQVIVAVNGRIRSFDKSTGLADGVLNVDPDVFFNTVLTPPATNNFTSDPRIRYDRLTDRWFLILIDVPGMTGSIHNRVLIAVSDAGVITPSTVWTFFQFLHDEPTPTSNKDKDKFFDYPSLGVDANALYIGGNVFGTKGVLSSFATTTAFVVRKSSLLGGGPIAVTPFRDLTSNNPNESGPFTPQGVDNFDPGATEGCFVGVASRLLGQLVLLRVSDPGGNPSMSEVYLTVPLTGDTITVPHLGNNNGSNGRLDGLDRRLIAAHLRNGHLWTCSDIAVDNTGSPNGTDTRMGIRWYELDGIASGQTFGLVQSGTLFQPSGSNTTDQRNYWMGSIMVSGQGHALLGFSAAGENEHANAGYAGRLVGDPLGTMRTPVLFTASTSAYNPPLDPGGSYGRRWGDYSYTVVDPDDDMTMWTFQEWCHAPNSYAVQILRVLAPPPATPTAVSPSVVDAGQSNLNVTVTGTIMDGSGFFDPGAGFPNHIAATVNGGGVTVNTVSYNSPTSVTLNLSLAANAAGGSRTIAITNPDGQSLTSSSGLLTVNPLLPTNNPPEWVTMTNQVVDEETLLTFTAQATDPDGDDLVFSLDAGAPAGAAVETNGLFAWTPTEDQGPSSNLLSVIVTDDGSPSLSATQQITIVVNEVNLPPQLATITDHTLHSGMSLVISNSATDLDIPENALNYSLDPGAPAAASIDAVTGVLTWLTDDNDVGSTNSITVRVTDDGLPPLDSSDTFIAVVANRPIIQSIVATNDQVNVTWSSIQGLSYRLQYKTNATDASWTDLSSDVTGTGALTAGEDTDATNNVRLYRVRTIP